MRTVAILAICLCSLTLKAQTRTITSKVIDEQELKAMPGVKILSRDSLFLGLTQTDGSFKIETASKGK